MITINEFETKELILWKDILSDIKSLVRVRVYKEDYNLEKIFNFSNTLPFPFYYIFTFSDVNPLSENLSIGLVNLSKYPGVWLFSLETKNVIDFDYEIIFTDLLFLNKIL